MTVKKNKVEGDEKKGNVGKETKKECQTGGGGVVKHEKPWRIM